MPFRYQRPRSVAAAWSRRLGWFALLLALTATLLHRFGLLALPNLVAVLLLSGALALVVLCLSAIGFAMLWLIGAKGGRAAFAGLILAGMVLAPLGFGVVRYLSLPPLIDIATDPANPPAWIEVPPRTLSWLPQPVLTADDSVLQLGSYPDLAGRRYDGAIDRVYEAVEAVVSERKWTQVATIGVEAVDFGLGPLAEPAEPNAAADVAPVVSGAGEADPARAPVPLPRPDAIVGPAELLPSLVTLQYSFTSPVLGVLHDVVIRLDEEEETTYVDMRVATRDGNHDLGLNADAVRGFLRELDVLLLGIAGS